MTFQAVPDTVEVVTDYLMSGAPTANVLHFKQAGVITQGALDTLALSMDSQAGVYMLPLFCDTQSYVQCRVRDLRFQDAMTASSGTLAGTGSLAAVQRPNNVSLCLTLRTGLAGRSARGRWYAQPPCGDQMASANIVTTTYRDALLNYMTHVRNAAAENGWVLVVVSRFHNKVRREEAITYPVTSVVARNLRVDSQRGRMPAPE